jgi:hypothetical protein
MYLKKILLSFMVVVLILVAVAGCKQSKLNITELIPQNANLIASIQIGKIINDRDFREAYDNTQKDSGQLETVEEGLDEFVRETGFDLRDFSQSIIFADLTRKDSDYGATIIEGTFAKEQFIGNIEKKQG